jgi:hypothetical protein
VEAEAVAASTSMEGIPVTVEEVHRILAGDRPPETRQEDAALVRGYRDAMSFVLRRADDAGFRWDRELLIEPPHVHVDRDDQKAKYWLAPVALARNIGFSAVELPRIHRLIVDQEARLLEAWNEHLRGAGG